jgi:hypothetical protein
MPLDGHPPHSPLLQSSLSRFFSSLLVTCLAVSVPTCAHKQQQHADDQSSNVNVRQQLTTTTLALVSPRARTCVTPRSHLSHPGSDHRHSRILRMRNGSSSSRLPHLGGWPSMQQRCACCSVAVRGPLSRPPTSTSSEKLPRLGPVSHLVHHRCLIWFIISVSLGDSSVSHLVTHQCLTWCIIGLTWFIISLIW